MADTLRLNINPVMLKWVKLEWGLHDEEIATKMGVKVATYLEFESGEAKPTLHQLRGLAHQIKTPVAMFYLKQQPDGTPFPDDYRNKHEERPLSIKARLAVRKAAGIREFLSGTKQFNREPNLTSFSGLKSAVKLAAKLREEIKYSPDQHISKTRLFNRLEDYMQTLNVFTLELEMSMSEMRGFSIFAKPSIIATAVSDADAGKLFTLLHEFAHILRRQEGICQPFDRAQSTSTIEQFCNQFAAEFLMTRKEFEESVGHNPDTNDNRLKEIADQYKTSREVILIKMIEAGLVGWGVWKAKKAKWTKEYENKDKFFGQPNPVTRTLKSNGKEYTGQIFELLHSDKITYSDAADRLGINVYYLDNVGERLSEGS